ncbi:MAG: DUF3226 domain-containing protein [Bryobacter sp.]|nr:DUF3226 domain-containing protein [Bryobacter sp.]
MKAWAVLKGIDEWHLLQHSGERAKELFKEPPKPKPSEPALSGDTVATRLSAALKDNTLNVICVICDAERQSADERWRALKNIVESAYNDCPAEFPERGLILNQKDRPKLGIWIMPDNIKQGMIEDFYLSAIPDGDPLLRESKEFLNVLKAKNLFQGQLSKSLYRVWLAIHAEPPGPAAAISRGLLKHDLGLLANYFDWLYSLIVDESKEPSIIRIDSA